MIDLFEGDAIVKLSTIKDNSIDLICTDIPYGAVNRKSNGLRNLDKKDADIVTFDLELLLKEFVRVCKGSIYIFCGTEQISTIRKVLVENGFSTRLMIWEKTNPSPMNGKSIWLSGIECCVYGKLPKATFNEHCKNTVLRYPIVRKSLHPTQKPLELITYLIKVSSNKGDTVLDSFMGSGTTGVASKELERNFIGCELNKDYFEIAKQRIENTVAKPMLFD